MATSPLSTWLRDYLYIPLGGNRKSNSRTYVNLLTVMIIGGLWHGASWNFLVWGALHGGYLAIHKIIVKKFPIFDDNKLLKSKKNKDYFNFNNSVFHLFSLACI